jgi:hypothetical protein
VCTLGQSWVWGGSGWGLTAWEAEKVQAAGQSLSGPENLLIAPVGSSVIIHGREVPGDKAGVHMGWGWGT